MPDQQVVHVCPYLGLENDPASHFMQPSAAHRCTSPRKAGKISEEYQEEYCFSGRYATCKRFVPLSKVAPPPIEPQGVDEYETVSQPVHRPRGLVRTSPLELALWGLAIVLAAVAVYSIWPMLFPPKTEVTVAASPTNTRLPTTTRTPAVATGTATLAATPSSTPLPPSTQAPIVLPTPPPDGQLLSLSPDQTRTGWVASRELAPHWGDRNLHAGTLQNQTYASVMQFDLLSLPPGSRILYAALEMTGRNSRFLGSAGNWQVELLDGTKTTGWATATADEVASTQSLAVLGPVMSPGDLATGQINRFEFNADQRKLLESQLNVGRLSLRIKGPESQTDNLFTWDAGSGAGGGLTAPTLYLVAIPAPYVVVTNTPTPGNVLTAAAVAISATAQAKQRGTPTPFPLGVATATPGGGAVLLVASPTAANAATVQARIDLATAVAVTTGTYTPLPTNVFVVTATPLPPTIPPFVTATPVLIGVQQITPVATPTQKADYLLTPVRPEFKGKLIVLSTRLGTSTSPVPILMSPTGQVEGVLSNPTDYQVALVREPLAPNGQERACVAPDANGILQIYIAALDCSRPTRQVTTLSRGMAYDGVWSPDGGKLAYVVDDGTTAEIYVYDLGTRISKAITRSRQYSEAGYFTYNQHPSWAPDSSRLVFKSNREENRFQIWLINADGSGLQNISRVGVSELDPVWVK